MPEASDFTTSTTFREVGLSPYLSRIAQHSNFIQPTPIQYHSLKNYLSNPAANLVCRSKSGTGKTFAYLSILLHSLITHQAQITDKTYSIILLPTRELAVQVYQTLTHLLQSVQFSKGGEEEKAEKEKLCKIRAILTIGGIGFEEDRKKYREQPFQIVISTVGRFWEMLNQHVVILNKNVTIILDEGDKMFAGKDDKFMKAIKMMSYVHKKWLIYSATFTNKVLKEIGKVCQFTYIHTLWKGDQIDLLVTDHVEAITAEGEMNEEFGNADLHMDNIRKFQITQAHPESQTLFQSKIEALQRLLAELQYQKCLIFVEKKSFLEQIYEAIIDFDPLLIHGSLSQAARFRIMNKINHSKLIIASDLLARGIDIRLDLVILFDAKQTDNFWHRIGRTGRYGRSGVALSLDPLEDPEWKPYQKQKINDILAGIESLEEKSWFGGHMTEIGKWTDVDERKQLQNRYRYYEQPIRISQPAFQAPAPEQKIIEAKKQQPPPKSIKIPQFKSESEFKDYVRELMSCRGCLSLMESTCNLTGYQFEILKYLD